ncbi:MULTISPECIES: acetyltransferase [Pseudomonas fluorescens group]|uniref:Transferase n=2 Tax=Pseudomonas fluorescens TaxID=294 RepID=C3K729_PSEFS|nr:MULTISPECIES: acetyltransferase [Pseudomonas fluorescens group]MBZ6456749.1 acetyltransferase [Pseudomonas fluorescens group sp.]MBZ6461016.1 acetyltransferase [Pseudomonas fluorescens group sp.]MBZ6469118.1 acetyltransferase [Pseudomonas fluorescens group sp.]MCF5666986.1 transferase [Pseudomonas marginalis]WQD73956.1 acetyltransferase [Pseudomonas marginalis]
MTRVKKLVILGAGGFGREVHAWLLDSIRSGACKPTDEVIWKIAGFIDDFSNAPDIFPGLPPILSKIDEYEPEPDSYVVCAIADPAAKKVLANKLLLKGVKFFSLIHSSVVVGTNVTIGKGAVICPFTVLSSDLVVGSFVTINSGCTIGHDSSIADYCTLSGHCDITGGAKLEEGAFLGSHAVIIPKVTVGEYAVVGAGSVVIRKVGPGVTVFGVPAKRISG